MYWYCVLIYFFWKTRRATVCSTSMKTFWCKTLIIHYKNSCFWQSMFTPAWHVFHTNEFAYKTLCFLMNWCKMFVLHWKFICFVIRARTLETIMWFSLGPYCKKSSKSLKKHWFYIVFNDFGWGVLRFLAGCPWWPLHALCVFLCTYSLMLNENPKK